MSTYMRVFGAMKLKSENVASLEKAKREIEEMMGWNQCRIS